MEELYFEWIKEAFKHYLVIIMIDSLKVCVQHVMWQIQQYDRAKPRPFPVSQVVILSLAII